MTSFPASPSSRHLSRCSPSHVPSRSRQFHHRSLSLTHNPTASFQPATYGPIAPPSRAGGSISNSGSGTSVAAATRSTRALTISSAASTSNNEDGVTGGGAPYNHQQRSSSGFDTSNPFAPLGDMGQSVGRATRVRRDESSSADTTVDGEEEQRGAPL